jgi:hypothetical protein
MRVGCNGLRETEVLGTETCLNATSTATNTLWTGLGLSRYFHGEEPAALRLAKGTRKASSDKRKAMEYLPIKIAYLQAEIRSRNEAQVLLSLLPGWVLNVVYVPVWVRTHLSLLPGWVLSVVYVPAWVRTKLASPRTRPLRLIGKALTMQTSIRMAAIIATVL